MNPDSRPPLVRVTWPMVLAVLLLDLLVTTALLVLIGRWWIRAV